MKTVVLTILLAVGSVGALTACGDTPFLTQSASS